MKSLAIAVIGLTTLLTNCSYSPPQPLYAHPKILTLATGKANQQRAIEYLISEGIEGKSKSALYVQMDEFADFAKTKWQVERYGSSHQLLEPVEYTRAKWNVVLNPKVCGFDDDFCTGHNENRPLKEVDKPLDIDVERDRVTYARFAHPEYLFEYLTNWKGKQLDRVIINGHASWHSFGQSQPTSEYVQMDQLLKQYRPEDFTAAISQSGKVFLHACATNQGHESKLTIGEVISYLLNAPVTGFTSDALVFTHGLNGPAEIFYNNITQRANANWFKNDKALIGESFPTEAVVIHPADVQKEVLAYRGRK